MSDETRAAAGKRFAQDLRRIREDRGVSVAAIHQQTQVAPSLVESFEEGGLYDHAAFNEVYLRSFVRAYAGVIGISAEVAVDGLDSALEGSYDHALADEYLQDRPVGEEAAAQEESGSSASDEEASSSPDRSDHSASETLTPESSSEESDAAPTDDASDDAASRPSVQPDTVPDEDPPLEGDYAMGQDPVPVGTVGGSSSDLPSPDRRSSGGSGDAGGMPEPNRQWLVAIGVLLLVLGSVGTGLWYVLGADAESPTSSQGPGSQSESRASVSLDTSDTAESSNPAENTAGPPRDTATVDAETSQETTSVLPLGETLHLTLRADSNVSRILIQRDDDLRRPYWIRQGEAATFPFTRRATVENEIDDVTVYLENRRVALRPDSSGRIVLDRDRVATLLKARPGPVGEWSSPPDTIALGAPPSPSSD